jgi:hypothetical protein
MTPTYSNPRVPEYPDYYVLDVAEIVEELLHNWQAVIAAEVQKHEPTHTYAYPQVYRVDPGNGEPVVEVYFGQHQYTNGGRWRPDVSFIIHHAIDAVKQNTGVTDDVEMALQLLEYDIATMAHHQLLPNVPVNAMEVAYANGRMKLAKLAAVFGKQLFQRFAQLGLYKNGYFPYHFAGWQDTCVLVELDPTHR